jgi:hypothetical protein
MTSSDHAGIPELVQSVGYAGATHGQHHRQELMGQIHLVRQRAVVCHQQPSRQSLGQLMPRIACRRLPISFRNTSVLILKPGPGIWTIASPEIRLVPNPASTPTIPSFPTNPTSTTCPSSSDRISDTIPDSGK